MQTEQQNPQVRQQPAGYPNRDLAGEVSVVTGASAGIGAATARELARRGSLVVLAARRAGELEEQARSIAAEGGQAIAIPTDISDGSQVEHLVAGAHEAFGKVDVLVNNAGIGWTKLLVNSTLPEIQAVGYTHLTCAMLMTRAVLPGMLQRQHGAIVNVSSVCGRVAVEPL